jgi:hypothetical protein
MPKEKRKESAPQERLEADRRLLELLAAQCGEEAGLHRPLNDVVGGVITGIPEDTDLAQALSDRETSDILVHLLDQNREQVERALERLREGTYGVCEGCGRRIPEAEALSHIAALSLCNEGTIRDWVRHAKFNVTQGKNFDRTGSIGPWLIPFTHEAQIADIRLETRVNGEVRQSDRTSRMIFSFRKIINYISTFTTLVPGDVIVTGTPTGAGARFDPPIWLKPGDVVEVEADGIGILRNTITDEV